jgi:hypothetical protein
MTSSPKPAAPRKWKTASAMAARRHLTPGQRAMVVAMILEVLGLGTWQESRRSRWFSYGKRNLPESRPQGLGPSQ